MAGPLSALEATGAVEWRLVDEPDEQATAVATTDAASEHAKVGMV
jgi:hypothetical protein